MAVGTLSIAGVSLVAIGAILYQFLLRDLLAVSLGIGREVQPIADFPCQCRRITGPGLEACEDMWLSESRRILYLACSSSLSRKEWMPNIGRFNVSGRPAEDKIIAMDIDSPAGNGYEYGQLQLPTEYTGVNGDGRLYVVGMTGIDHDDRDELFVVNARPSIDLETGDFLDQASMGGNSTIEQFSVDAGGDVHLVTTWSNPEISTPNRVAPSIDGSFYFTNDHGPHKAGIRHTLSDVLKSGDVSYCNSASGECKLVSSGHGFPNGLALGNDGLLYVPSAMFGSVQVYHPNNDGSITKLADVDVPMPLDNISPDLEGDLYIAGLPQAFAMMGGFDDPLNANPPATVWKVHKNEDGTYEASKAVEDRDGEVLPGATTAVHDARTGRLFISGVYSPFVTVCERKGFDAGAQLDELAGQLREVLKDVEG